MEVEGDDLQIELPDRDADKGADRVAEHPYQNTGSDKMIPTLGRGYRPSHCRAPRAGERRDHKARDFNL